jgi:murein L,D-transpeptidase YcbB/YkuD
MLFDETLEHGVRRFQRRHGLKVDGIVGPATLAALNVSVEERIRQIKLNLERWRWLPHDLGQKYVMVNIANSELNIIENDHIIKKMRAVVGRKTRRTPIFSDQITYLELNPYWHIPPKIARKDILPHIHNDPRYLIKQRIRVFENWKDQASEIDPLAIDWSLITENNFSFKLRQEPVPSNALGRIKFMFPNKFGVYIHDTPARNLFRRTKRYFSSGCIRIEKPVELADYLLRDNPQWPLDKLKAAINSQKREIIALPEPVAVYILYWTAWVEEDGSINFREDVYGWDKPLDTAWHHRFPDDGRIHAKPTQGSFSLSQRRMNTAELMTSRE